MTEPLEIKVHTRSATLELCYAGYSHVLPAEYLRVFSPSAEVQGHSNDQAVLQTGKRHVTIKDIEPQGHYALKLVFSDGHDSGIFSWTYLAELGENLETYWAEYLARLQAAGESREPRFIAVST